MARNRVIGCENRLPWHLPADLQRFRALTWGKPLLMGRKTHESIGRALPGRLNLVLSSDPDYRAEGCRVLRSLDELPAQVGDAPEVMVIGGSSVYAALLPLAARLYLTTIERDYPGDVRFPEVDLRTWVLQSRECVDGDERFGAVYCFEVWERTAADVAA